MKKGQSILAVIMWSAGVTIPIGIGFLAWTYTGFAENNEKHEILISNVATLQSESDRYKEDIAAINLKLDKITEKLGIISKK